MLATYLKNITDSVSLIYL